MSPEARLGQPELTVADYRRLQETLWWMQHKEGTTTPFALNCSDFLDHMIDTYPELHEAAMEERRQEALGDLGLYS